MHLLIEQMRWRQLEFKVEIRIATLFMKPKIGDYSLNHRLQSE